MTYVQKNRQQARLLAAYFEDGGDILFRFLFDFSIVNAFADFVFHVRPSSVEFADTFADAAHQFRNFVAAEKQKDSEENENHFLSAQAEYQKN